MSKTAVSIFLIATLLLTSSACGWRLRGGVSGNVHFEHIYIRSSDLNGELVRQLKRQLEASGVKIMDKASEAFYSLIIVKENSKRRTATVSASARVSERSLTEQVQFMVVDKQGNSVIPPSTVRTERVFEYNENNVLATNDEAHMLKREMKIELARQIYNRLRQLNNPTETSDAPAS